MKRVGLRAMLVDVLALACAAAVFTAAALEVPVDSLPAPVSATVVPH